MPRRSMARLAVAKPVPALRSHFVRMDKASHPDAQKLLSYWRACVARGGFAMGRDIPARAIAAILRNLAICEPLADGSDMRMRLAGDGFRRRFDEQVKGRLLSELFPPEDFAHHLDASLRVLRTGEPIIIDSCLMRANVVELRLEVVVLALTAPDLVSRWLLVGLFYFD